MVNIIINEKPDTEKLINLMRRDSEYEVAGDSDAEKFRI